MKIVVLSVLLSFFSILLFSQSEAEDSSARLKFGFNLGTSYSNLQSIESLPDNAEIYNGFGFKLGVLMDYLMSNKFSFSPKAEFSFNKSGVETTNNDNEISTYKVFPIMLEVMTHFVYKIGNGKTIPYLLAGPNLRLPIYGMSESSSEFKSKPDFAIDFGIGLENKLRYFIFSPELRYSYGLLNVNENPAIENLHYHNMSLVLNFK